MKKVLTNILKWVVCVFITFTVIFTISQVNLIATGIYFQTEFLGNEEEYAEFFKEENLEEMAKYQNEIVGGFFTQNVTGEENTLAKVYLQYPAGITKAMCEISNYMLYGEAAIVSLGLGIVIGTAIYMLLDKDKKGLKIALALYVISIVILGFVQGFINILGEELTLLDRWMFPDEYIVPVTIAFAVVVIVRFLKQKDIAKKLNEKLKEIKNK